MSVIYSPDHTTANTDSSIGVDATVSEAMAVSTDARLPAVCAGAFALSVTLLDDASWVVRWSKNHKTQTSAARALITASFFSKVGVMG